MISDTKYQLRQTCSNNSSIVTTIVTRLKRAKCFGSNNKILFFFCTLKTHSQYLHRGSEKFPGKDRGGSAEKKVPGVTDLPISRVLLHQLTLFDPFAQTLLCFLELTAISLATGSRVFSPMSLSGEPSLTFPKQTLPPTLSPQRPVKSGAATTNHLCGKTQQLAPTSSLLSLVPPLGGGWVENIKVFRQQRSVG